MAAYLVDGEPWILAGRVRGRSEAGEGRPGRMYTEAHYLATPVSAWSVAAVPALAGVLAPEPPTNPGALPTVSTDCSALDQPLPDGWLTAAAASLEVLLSGQTLSIQTWDIPVDQFLWSLFPCLVACPPALRWRLPFGAGIYEMTGQHALSVGMRAMSGIRDVGGDRRGLEGVDLSAGRGYCRWLEMVAGDAVTYRDVQEAVDERLPRYGRALSLDASVSWDTAAAAIGAVVGESLLLEDLREALHPDPTPVPRHVASMPFRVLRDEALGLVLERLREGGAALLHRVTEEPWRPNWPGAVAAARSAEVTATAALLGMGPSIAPDGLDQVRDLWIPPSLTSRTTARLSEALVRSGAPWDWAGIVAPRQGDANWLAEWREAAESTLVWQAIRSARLGPSSDFFAAVEAARPGSAVLASAVTLSEGGLPPARRILDLVRSADRNLEEEVDWLARAAIQKGGALGPLQLLEAATRAGLKPKIGKTLLSMGVAGWAGIGRFVTRLAAEILDSGLETLSPAQYRILLLGWDEIHSERRARLAPQLAARLGKPWADLLVGASGGASVYPKVAQVASEVAVARLPHDPHLQASLLAYLERPSGRLEAAALESTNSLLYGWLAGTKIERLPKQPGLRFAAGLVQGKVPALPETIGPTDVELVRRMLAVVASGAGSMPNLGALLGRCQTAGQIRSIMALVPPGVRFDLPAEQLALLLVAISDGGGSRAEWDSVVRANRLAKQEGWRLLAEHRGKLFGSELVALSRLPAGPLIRLSTMPDGFAIPGEHLDRIGAQDLRDFKLTSRRAGLLAMAARDTGAKDLEYVLLDWALRAFKKTRPSPEDIDEFVMSRRGITGRLFGLRRSPTPDELAEVPRLVAHLVSRVSRRDFEAVVDTYFKRKD